MAVGAGVSEEAEGQDTGAEAVAGGFAPAAMALALVGASRENAGAFLKDQRVLIADHCAEPPPAPSPAVSEEPQVEIHKPKPVHNWREFLSEVGVVVLGVCIALAAEQGVEWWRWREQVAQARAVIASEMALNLVGAITRLRTEDCMEKRLDALTDIVDAASRSGQLPPVGEIGQPPPRLWRSGAWESVVAAQTAAHFPRQQLAELGSLYQLVSYMQSNNQLELQAWSSLHIMSGPGRRLDSASEADLRRALSLARGTSRAYTSQAITLLARTEAMKLPFSSGDLKLIADAKNVSLTAPTNAPAIPDLTSAICGQIGAVPPRYGQSPFPLIPKLSNKALKNLSDFGAP